MKSTSKTKNRVMLVDMLNMFYRAYIVDPSLASNGQPIGGVKGSLKILQKLMRQIRPDQVIICWDGEGGSARRRIIEKDYKAGRKPIRLNRDLNVLSENAEIQNKIWQQLRLVEYFNELPLVQFMHKGVEADDVIAYLVQNSYYSGWHKIIVSSDKDFYQLCDDETVVFRPVQDQAYNKDMLTEEFNIHPNNFAIARALAGDRSDNLEGVGRLGLKTAAKRFPFLKDSKKVTINEVIDFAKSELTKKKLKLFQNVVDNEDIFRRNYKMMQLSAPMLHYDVKKAINHALDEFEPTLNKTGIKTMMIKDGFGEMNISELFAYCQKVVRG